MIQKTNATLLTVERHRLSYPNHTLLSHNLYYILTMVSLLDIPREVRDKILLLVVSTPQPPPSGYMDAGSRVPLPYTPCKSWSISAIKYSPHMNRTTEFPTLLANRQLHDETLEAIGRLSKKPTYVLDIMLVKGASLWPTWLSVPALWNSIDKVHATFRIDTSSRNTMRGFRGGDGSPPKIAWSFYGVLERFLMVGPTVNPALNKQGIISINTLEMNVETSKELPEGQPVPDELRHNTAYDIKTLNADFLVSVITSYIQIILRMDYHTADKGRILYERIGTIRILRDGELQTELDMARQLRDIEFDNSFGDIVPCERRPEYFKNWKIQTYETRVRLGLSVLPVDENRPASM